MLPQCVGCCWKWQLRAKEADGKIWYKISVSSLTLYKRHKEITFQFTYYLLTATWVEGFFFFWGGGLLKIGYLHSYFLKFFPSFFHTTTIWAECILGVSDIRVRLKDKSFSHRFLIAIGCYLKSTCNINTKRLPLVSNIVGSLHVWTVQRSGRATK